MLPIGCGGARRSAPGHGLEELHHRLRARTGDSKPLPARDGCSRWVLGARPQHADLFEGACAGGHQVRALVPEHLSLAQALEQRLRALPRHLHTPAAQQARRVLIFFCKRH